MNVIKLDEEAIYQVARGIGAPEAREAYLQQVCGDDTALRDRLEALLRVCEQEASFLEVSPHDAAAGAPAPIERPGTFIGPYKLMEQLGEGGMGVVYVAEQQVPVRRKVALKVIKPGMDTRQVIARFEAERQALAMMDHPNIAKVFDGGVTDSGRPYFVMELVRGLPITEYCDQEQLSIRERLDLFVLVCRAVQHAHQKGIIHRDLKPSNILVTLHDGVPVPKVIDFGVAKATGQSLTEKTVYTAFTQLVGTPLYMSPEQVEFSSLDIDTRSDIYSLGVLLYELLTGTTPFDPEALRRAAFDEMRRIIREDEPPTPSMRLNTLGQTLTTTSMKRSSDPRRLNRSVRGELDWIAMKALEKDRNRRYETANDFAADVTRYLTDQPVEACPPSASYRLKKFARRNRGAITTATVLAVALGLGTAFSAWQAILARRAERDAVAAWAQKSKEEQKTKQSEADTQTFSDFLVNDMLAVARPEGVQGGLGVGVTVAQALEAAETTLEKRFAGRPLAEATARDAIGKTWRNLAKYQQAERHLRRAVELRERKLGPDDPATLNSRNSLGVLLSQAGRYAEAIALLEETLKKRQAKLGLDHPDTFHSMNNLAMAYAGAGQIDRALPLQEATLKTQQVKLGPDHPDTLQSMNNLAKAFLDSGKLDQALPLLKQTLEKRKAKFGPDHPDTLESVNNLAVLYRAAGKSDQALPLLEETLEKAKAKLDPDHSNTLTSMNNLARAYQAAGKFDQALKLFELTLEKRKAKLGPDNPDTLRNMNNLAIAYKEAGKLDQALPLREQTFQKRKAKLGPDHPDTLESMNNLAMAFLDSGKPDIALPLLEELLEKANANLAPHDPHTLICMDNLARSYKEAGKLDQALPLLKQTLEKRKAKFGPDHPDTLESMNNLALAYLTAGKPELALPLFEQTLQKRKAKSGPDHADTLQSMNNLAIAYKEAGKLDQALPLLEQTLQTRKANLGPGHPDTLQSMNNLAMAYVTAAQSDQALPLLEELLEKAKANLGPDDPRTLICMDNLARSYKAAGKLDQAVQLHEQTLRMLKAKLAPDHPQTLKSMNNLASAYFSAGKPDLALPLFEQALEKLKAKLGTENTDTLVCMNNLASCYAKLGQPEKAEPLFRYLAKIWKEKAGADSPQYAQQLASLGLNLLEQHKPADAEPLLRECLAIREKTQPDAWTTFNTKSMLGASLLGQKNYADAEPLLLSGYEGMKQREKKIPPESKIRLTEALERLVQLYDALGRKDKADGWRKKLPVAKSAKPTETRTDRRLMRSSRQASPARPRSNGWSARKETSHRRVARQSRDAVEVGVVAGDPGQAVGLHDRQDEGIVAQQAGLLAQHGGGFDEGVGNGQDLNAELGHFGDGLVELAQLLHGGWILTQMLHHFGGPTEDRRCFRGSCFLGTPGFGFLKKLFEGVGVSGPADHPVGPIRPAGGSPNGHFDLFPLVERQRLSWLQDAVLIGGLDGNGHRGFSRNLQGSELTAL